MIAFPFDSRLVGYDADGMPQYDHASNASEFALLLSSFLTNGIFGSTMCEVLEGGGLTATVGTGGMLIEGRFGYITTPQTVTFAAGEAYNRIDTVVLRRDLSTAVNDLVVAVVKGTAASTPAVPELTRDGTVWELGLANVLIPANSAAVSQANITDTRLDNNRCGLCAAILTDIDTSALYAQIQADLAYFKDVEEEGIREWLQSIQGILEGDVAANLAFEVSKKSSSKMVAVTLSASGWSSDDVPTQTVTVNGVTADESRIHVIPNPVPAQYDAYASSGIRATVQGNGVVTFAASSAPDEDIAVNILVIDSGVVA